MQRLHDGVHNWCHLPFRSWCSACVRGRGLSMGHAKVSQAEKEAEAKRIEEERIKAEKEAEAKK